MYKEISQSLLIFLVSLLVLFVSFCVFIRTIIYRYKRNNREYFEGLEAMRARHESNLLRGQLDIQEYTFTNISREIHDNVGQKLSLAKLLLNTQVFENVETAPDQVKDSVVLISEAIDDLSDISKTMSSEVILNNGLVSAIEFEISQLQKSGLYKAFFILEGQQIFLESKMELNIFRIVQESFHNIIKHANASDIYIRLQYKEDKLILAIEDNGGGFQIGKEEYGTGLKNIKARTSKLDGKFSILTNEKGTCLNFDIPIKPYTDA